VVLKNGAKIDAGTPHIQFSVPWDSQFEIMGDGRFLILEPAGTSRPTTVMLNWRTALNLRN
jgi:hypothetical protein